MKREVKNLVEITIYGNRIVDRVFVYSSSEEEVKKAAEKLLRRYRGESLYCLERVEYYSLPELRPGCVMYHSSSPCAIRVAVGKKWRALPEFPIQWEDADEETWHFTEKDLQSVQVNQKKV